MTDDEIPEIDYERWPMTRPAPEYFAALAFVLFVTWLSACSAAGNPDHGK